MSFDSWEAVRRFSGEDYERAYVPPKAREANPDERPPIADGRLVCRDRGKDRPECGFAATADKLGLKPLCARVP